MQLYISLPTLALKILLNEFIKLSKTNQYYHILTKAYKYDLRIEKNLCQN